MEEEEKKEDHLKSASHEKKFFSFKFAFGEYNHVHSVVLKVWFVKCL